ncbi:MAG: YtxH domain-containing protein [Bacteroidetes bacterium]|nr:YtxH domain-containing protein [Bacteroidota bacterium]MCH8524896.1 YtxH domain-containing protein [Balneolales bacterium]
MSTKNGLNILVAAVGLFAAGIAAGLLLSPKSGRENRDYIRKGADSAGSWVHTKRSEAQQKAHQVSDKVKRTVKEHVPDLYEATNSLHLDEDDVKTSRETN